MKTVLKCGLPVLQSQNVNHAAWQNKSNTLYWRSFAFIRGSYQYFLSRTRYWMASKR
jgi:hypothetical protein